MKQHRIVFYCVRSTKTGAEETPLGQMTQFLAIPQTLVPYRISTGVKRLFAYTLHGG